ncbi:hypothetical protein PGQ11_010571 [Apiospora arundinis]|uniref:Uncharacterized protein n=1 Tax=Apiospora arundinis TaxID=335852 RepID=A0ABR2IAK6_9PEZI
MPEPTNPPPANTTGPDPSPMVNGSLWSMTAAAMFFLVLRFWIKISRRCGLWWDDGFLALSFQLSPLIFEVEQDAHEVTTSLGNPCCEQWHHKRSGEPRLRYRSRDHDPYVDLDSPFWVHDVLGARLEQDIFRPDAPARPRRERPVPAALYLVRHRLDAHPVHSVLGPLLAARLRNSGFRR